MSELQQQYLTESGEGHLISKGLFGILNSPTKRTKKFDFATMVPQVELFSFVFLGELKTPKRHFEINWPLAWPHFFSSVLHTQKNTISLTVLPVAGVVNPEIYQLHPSYNVYAALHIIMICAKPLSCRLKIKQTFYEPWAVKKALKALKIGSIVYWHKIWLRGRSIGFELWCLF